MEPEGSLLYLQVPAACPYPEPDQPCPCTLPSPSPFQKIPLSVITPVSSNWSFSFMFLHQTLVCTAPLPHLILFLLIHHEIATAPSRYMTLQLLPVAI